MKCKIDAIATVALLTLSLSIGGCGSSDGNNLLPPPTVDADTTGIWTGTFVRERVPSIYSA